MLMFNSCWSCMKQTRSCSCLSVILKCKVIRGSILKWSVIDGRSARSQTSSEERDQAAGRSAERGGETTTVCGGFTAGELTNMFLLIYRSMSSVRRTSWRFHLDKNVAFSSFSSHKTPDMVQVNSDSQCSKCKVHWHKSDYSVYKACRIDKCILLPLVKF